MSNKIARAWFEALAGGSVHHLTREQNREPISFQFLWDELGISRR